MIAILIICTILFFLSMMGRTGHKGLSALKNRAYAHRGLYDDKIPENSLQAFQRAKGRGFGIELDVHLLADGNLAVLHDSMLERITGKTGRIEELTTKDLKDYNLNGTAETIPLFSDVLELCNGEIPLIVELKSTKENYGKLCEKVCQVLDAYNGMFCLESFDPRCVLWLRKHRPDLIRGQLSQNYFIANDGKLPWYFRFLLTFQMLNFLTQPDFIAYRFRDRNNISNFFCRKIWKIQGVSWTLKNRQDYETAISENWIPIFEGFIP